MRRRRCTCAIAHGSPPAPLALPAAIGALLSGILQRNSVAVAAGAPAFPVHGVKVVNNLDWFGPMSFLTFLREVGKFARVGTMLAKDSVRSLPWCAFECVRASRERLWFRW